MSYLLYQKLPPRSFIIKSIGLPTPSPEHCGSSKMTFAFSSLGSPGSSSMKSSCSNWISGDKRGKLRSSTCKQTCLIWMCCGQRFCEATHTSRETEPARPSSTNVKQIEELDCSTFHWSLLMGFWSPVGLRSDCVLWMNQRSAWALDQHSQKQLKIKLKATAKSPYKWSQKFPGTPPQYSNCL